VADPTLFLIYKRLRCPWLPHVSFTRKWKIQEVSGLFAFFLSISASVHLQQFSPLHSPSSHNRRAEENYQREKDRFCYVGNFSPFKPNRSVPATQPIISPNPFTKVDICPPVPAGATCPSGQSEQEVRRPQEWEKHLWEDGITPLHTYHTILSLVFLLSFFPSFLCSQGSVLQSHQQLL